MTRASPRSRARAAGVVRALAALAVVLALAGCGFGPGEEVGDAELVVTRDFGAEAILERQLSGLTESDSVIRVLERNAEIETRYGGGFVHAIEGLEGGSEDGRPHDWLYFVNGIEADRGSADYLIDGGDRIWWDYRDWSVAMSVPAVVGQFPEPFLNGYDGGFAGGWIDCRGAESACDRAAERLEAEGVELEEGAIDGAIRVVVGPWAEIAEDPEAGMLDRGPEATGVFARPGSRDARDPTLEILGPDGTEAEQLGPGAGLVAATRRGDRAPVWVLTGVDVAGVESAAEVLRPEILARSFAVAIDGDRVIPLPVR